MSLIPSDFINSLITRTDIVELIGSRIGLKKTGRNYQACCPFHEERTPSFTVNQQKQFYYCFGCGAGGNAIGFLMTYERLEFVEAVEVLAKSLGLEVPTSTSLNKSKKNSMDLYTPLEKKNQFYQYQLTQHPRAMKYLVSRNLSLDIIKKYQIGFSPEDKDGFHKDAFRGRIIFPIHDRRGRVIGFGGRVLEDQRLPKYLNSPDSPIFHKGEVLYGLYQVREAYRNIEKILVVEGYMDVVSLAQAGINFAVATLGTATTIQHVSQLLQHTSRVIFCFDGDNAGRKAAWRALESALLAMRDDSEIFFLFLPESEDPDSLIKTEGSQSFLQRLEQSQSLADFFFGYLKFQANINTPAGRSKLANLALPYLESIPAVLFREIMIDKLSEIVRIEKSRLFLSSAQQKISSPSQIKIQRTPMRLALSLLIQYPVLGSKIPQDIFKSMSLWNFKGSELLKQMMTLLKDYPQFTTANILEFFKDTPEKNLLYKLAMWDHGVPEAGIESEWRDILNVFEKKHREHCIEKLLQKSHLNALNDTERRELQALLAKKSDLV